MAAVRAGSDSTTAGSTNLGLTSSDCAALTVSRLRSGELAGMTIRSPSRTSNWGPGSFVLLVPRRPNPRVRKAATRITPSAMPPQRKARPQAFGAWSWICMTVLLQVGWRVLGRHPTLAQGRARAEAAAHQLLDEHLASAAPAGC